MYMYVLYIYIYIYMRIIVYVYTVYYLDGLKVHFAIFETDDKYFKL